MKRRDLLKSIGALAATFALSESKHAYAQAKSLPKLIDVHCHVFNMADLPAEDFVRKVLLQERLDDLKRRMPWLRNVLDTPKIQEVLSVIVEEIRVSTAKPKFEIDLLIDGKSRNSEARTTAEINTLERLLEHIWKPDMIIARIQEHDGTELDDDLIHLAAQQIRYSIKRELNLLPVRDADVPDYDPDELNTLKIAEKLYASDKSFGILARWVLAFSVRRSELVDQLYALHGGSKNVVLMTPALVDFSMWLTEDFEDLVKPNTASIQAQVDVMAQVAKRPNGPRVHGFVAYDPLYEAMTRKHPAKFPATPLKTVMDAINNKGFLGVKLYPPMGFRAFRNKDMGAKFPRRVLNASSGLGANAGEQIDKALEDLYQWCADNEVPIMAHANNSNGSHGSYSLRANPFHWHPVFEWAQAKNLRISLAHFGGFEETVNTDLDIRTTWEWGVGEIWKKFKQAQLYADLSYLEEILLFSSNGTNNAAVLARVNSRAYIKAGLIKFKAEFPMAADRLMFGSDWSMLGADEGLPRGSIHDPYAISEKPLVLLVDEFLFEVGFDQKARNKILFSNAVQFLGLEKTDRKKTNRTRLEQFYATNNLSAQWMESLDSA